MAVEEFRRKLSAQLPTTLPIYRVESIPVESPAAAQLLEQAEYVLIVQCLSPSDSSNPSQGIWQSWIDQILATPEILVEHTTKSGKLQQVNLRDRLIELQLLSTSQLLEFMQTANLPLGIGLRYQGSCRNDGTLLRPEHVIQMLELVSKKEFQLLRIHRQQLVLLSSRSSI
jgi:radical SAM-linked protein